MLCWVVECCVFGYLVAGLLLLVVCCLCCVYMLGLCLHVILKFVGLFGLFTLLVNAAFLGRFGVLIVRLDLLLVLGLIAV